MGNKAVIALFGMSGLLILFATYASLLPDVLESRAEVEIAKSKVEIKSFLNTASDWEEWLFEESLRNSEDWKVIPAGKASGEGSVLKWLSERIGDGGLEIKKLDTNQIIFERISDNNSFRDRCYLNLESTRNGTKIIMIDSLDVSTNFIARYDAQDEQYLKMIDSSNVEVLKRLKSKIEAE